MAVFTKKIIETINTPFFFSVELVYCENGLMTVNFVDKKGVELAKHPFSHITRDFISYFEGKKVSFSGNLVFPELPEFTRRVLTECRNIPYGEVTTYKELAAKCGSARAFRAVGNALRKNPFPIIIPCHRVIGTDGDLTGFMGKDGIEIKRCLLRLEGR